MEYTVKQINLSKAIKKSIQLALDNVNNIDFLFNCFIFSFRKKKKSYLHFNQTFTIIIYLQKMKSFASF